MALTRHAGRRCQQRCISPMMVELLLEFGQREAAGDGATKVFFDKRARRRLQKYAGSLAASLQGHLDVYLVLGEQERVITTGHRTERIRRS